MPRPTIKELERTLQIEQEGILFRDREVEKLRKQIEGMHGHIEEQRRYIAWLKRVIECLVSPNDNTRAF